MDWLKQVQGPFVLYRGLADADWEVESSGYRRIRPKSGEAPPSVFHNYIERLLNRASLQGFRERGGTQRSDLELLAELQHNGAASCLIDFTENALVALWFACREKPEQTGKVVAMATEETEDFSIVTYDDLKKSIKDYLNKGKLWKWKPSDLNNRIVAQGSVFVFGEGKIEKRHYEEIRVNANSKGRIREELKEKFGITEEQLFSDFTGFALSNAHDRPYSYTAEDYFYLGLTFAQRRVFEKAIEAYGQAIELDPQNMEAYRNRGIAKRFSEDFSGAITDFDQAITLNPQSSEAYAGRGITKYVSGDHQGAIADLTQAIDFNLEVATVYNHRGLAKYYSDDYPGAITDFDKAIELNPQYVWAFNNRGLARYYSVDYPGAITDFDKAIELNPQYVTAYNNRGLAKLASGDLSGAIADFDKAIGIDSEYANAYTNRGLTKRALGDDAGAAADFAKAQELDPSLEPPESP